jgi:hypothetical protein
MGLQKKSLAPDESLGKKGLAEGLSLMSVNRIRKREVERHFRRKRCDELLAESGVSTVENWARLSGVSRAWVYSVYGGRIPSAEGRKAMSAQLGTDEDDLWPRVVEIDAGEVA